MRPRNFAACLLLFLAVLFACEPIYANDPQERYVAIFKLIEDGDALHGKQQTNAALVKYSEAHQQLTELRKWNPSWNTKVVNYRLNYLAERIRTLSAPPPVAVEEPPVQAIAPATPARSTTPSMEVTLLDAGAEPRQVLRLRPQPGDRQRATMTLKTTTDMTMGDMPGQNLSIPAVNMTLVFVVGNVSDDGVINYEMQVVEASVAGADGDQEMLASVIESAFAGIKGMTTQGSMSSRGFTQKQAVKLSPRADPMMRQQMEQMNESLAGVSSPLPEEAVGPGARWQVRQTLKSQGMTLQQTTTYELVSMQGDQLELKARVEQTAKAQRVANPAMPGMQMNLTHLTGTGTGTFTLDLNHLFPTAAQLDSNTDMGMGINLGGQQQTMNMKLGMQMRWQQP